jgi:hypothetical protein
MSKATSEKSISFTGKKVAIDASDRMALDVRSDASRVTVAKDNVLEVEQIAGYVFLHLRGGNSYLVDCASKEPSALYEGLVSQIWPE